MITRKETTWSDCLKLSCQDLLYQKLLLRIQSFLAISWISSFNEKVIPMIKIKKH